LRASLSLSRIVLATSVLALIAWVGVAALRPSTGGPVQSSSETWLTLPTVSMDARELHVRQLLLAAMTAETGVSPPRDPLQTLAMTCGNGAPDEPAEQYTALIGTWVLAPDPEAWRVRMVPSGSTMWVSVDRSVMNPPPPPPPGVQGTAPLHRPAPHTFVIPIERLEGIRDAWSSADIWKQAKEWKGCTDGRPALFEACVLGRYVASRRVCGEATAALDRLWARMRNDLPVPPLADADTSRVESRR
jgi:hypothetical protein